MSERKTKERDWIGRYGVGLALAALVLLAAIAVPGFFTRANLTTVLLHVSVNAILALGITFVIVTAGIDLPSGPWQDSPACWSPLRLPVQAF